MRSFLVSDGGIWPVPGNELRIEYWFFEKFEAPSFAADLCWAMKLEQSPAGEIDDMLCRDMALPSSTIERVVTDFVLSEGRENNNCLESSISSSRYSAKKSISLLEKLSSNVNESSISIGAGGVYDINIRK